MDEELCWFFFFKQKTAYEMRISDWSSDVCSSDLLLLLAGALGDREEGEVEQSVLEGVGDPFLAGDPAGPGDGVLDLVVLQQLRRLCARLPPHRDMVLDLLEAGEGAVEIEGIQILGLHAVGQQRDRRSEEHTSELQSLMRISYAGFCLKKK